MSDIALRWVNGEGQLIQAGADLLSDDSLTTAVLLSLFTDRRADVADRLPDDSGDRRGWWGDSYRPRPIGSRLWLLAREKTIDSVLTRAEDYAREALGWLREDGHILALECRATQPHAAWLWLHVRLTLPRDGVRPYTFKATLQGI